MKKYFYFVYFFALLCANLSLASFVKDDSNVENPVTEQNKNYSYVDLGLSVKWATCNIGAEKPEDYGDYFAWGETKGYNSGRTNFGWDTYKWCNGSDATMTKYCTKSSCGTVDDKTTLDAEDDAATANWGSEWRMPTKKEWKELKNKCTWTVTQLNGVYGYKVTSKKSGYKDKFIFLPFAGDRIGTNLRFAGACGTYWSNSLSTRFIDCASTVGFSPFSYGVEYCGRNHGLSVRAVRIE